MKMRRRIGTLCLACASGWLALCVVIGIIAAEGALHPIRLAIKASDQANADSIAGVFGAKARAVSIRAADNATLNAWEIKPARWNGDEVFLLHGQSDNRAGMMGPAEMLLGHGYEVLLPDARAHGQSGGKIATYGVLEREDIRAWFAWALQISTPHCIDAIGDSMGAAQLLESLTAEPGFCAVVADSPFANFREAAFTRMGQQLGTGAWAGRTILRPAVEFGLLYARAKYEVDLGLARPDDAVVASRVPVLLIHGLKDDNLPPRNSENILARSRGHNPSVALWEPANAGHCGASSAQPEEYERRVTGWFSNHER